MGRTVNLSWLALLILTLCRPAWGIVNGVDVSDAAFESEFPWVVAIENMISGGVCTAALISPTYVLTAAHCLSNGTFHKRLVLGDSLRSRARIVKIADAIRHPRYDNITKTYDLGLIRLDEAVDIEPLPLMSLGEYFLLVSPEAPATIAGWGQRQPGRESPDRLTAAQVRLHRLYLSRSELIFTDLAGPCSGDSGGPLTVKGIDGFQVLVGIASRTDGNLCASDGGASIYTNILGAMEFIEANVTDLNGKKNSEPGLNGRR